MERSSLDALLARISDSGLLDDPVAENGIVHGRAILDAAGAAVTVNVDPESEDDADVDHDALIDGVTRILSVNESSWRAVIDAIAEEIEEAVADDEVVEQTDLRAELEVTSVVVFADAVLLGFDAPKQFPDSRILVQLDDELEITNIEVSSRDGIETVDFDSLDDLLDHISDTDER